VQTELTPYLKCLTSARDAADDSDLSALLQASYLEAQRVMSPLGLDNYLQGMRALSSLGKGQDFLLVYLQQVPAVVKAVGEDVLPDIVESLMQMASLTSGTVMTKLLATLPFAAIRLGDADLMRGYLRLLHQLAAKVPRGLRPMLESLDELLSRLTLGGLRRWAMWGAEAYQRDFAGQAEFFSITSETSKSVLQRERRGCLFVDHQRKLNFYLRALWGRALPMRPTASEGDTQAGNRPFIEDYQLQLPDAYDTCFGIDGLDVYRAAVAHAAAHLEYSDEACSTDTLDGLQLCCIELIEDGRVEYLACRRFPGLRRLWLRFFIGALQDSATARDPGVEQFLRIGRALLDPGYRDEEDWIHYIALTFHSALDQKEQPRSLALELGLECHKQLLLHGTPAPVQVLRAWPIPYRDDNRYFRDFATHSMAGGDTALLPWRQASLRKQVGLMQMVNEIDSELKDGRPQEIWVLASELFPYEDQGISYNQSEGGSSLSPPCHYDEWDYRVQLQRPHWTTLIEHRPERGDAEHMEHILEKHKPVANRLRHLIERLQPRGVVRRRGYEDGDELDIGAAVSAMTDMRRGVMPDPRVNIRITRHWRDLSLLVLLDLSASTNEPVACAGEFEGQQPTVLDLTREACGLLAWAVDSIGDRFAMHGFASDGRHDVRYYRLKDFDEAYDENVRARLAGMQGGLSTRMGTALRHAGRQLLQQPSQKRLVLVITDGEPADIDERDPRYLREDCRHAVDELSAQGVHSFCLTLDPQADAYVAHIFGTNNYSIVDNVMALPERLPRMFSALTS
jgi:nitric oxide reductase NorD protein